MYYKRPENLEITGVFVRVPELPSQQASKQRAPGSTASLVLDPPTGARHHRPQHPRAPVSLFAPTRLSGQCTTIWRADILSEPNLRSSCTTRLLSDRRSCSCSQSHAVTPSPSGTQVTVTRNRFLCLIPLWLFVV